MKKLLVLTIGLLMCGCEDNHNVTTDIDAPIKLDNGLYVKEYCIGAGSFSSIKYVYVQCDAEGKFIKGLSCTHSSGKHMLSTAIVSAIDETESIADTDETESAVYKNLRDKYGVNSDFGLYLKLRDKYESK